MSKNVFNTNTKFARIKDSKINGPVLTHMRAVVYGKEACLHIFQTLDRAERMRNDQELLDKAAAKRLRKMERNKK